MTAPFAFSTRSTTPAIASSSRPRMASRGSGPRGSAGPRRLRVVRFAVAFFFVGGRGAESPDFAGLIPLVSPTHRRDGLATRRAAGERAEPAVPRGDPEHREGDDRTAHRGRRGWPEERDRRPGLDL